MTNETYISVVVTTRNEQAHIERCLASVAAQSYAADRRELIVVDNDSTDRTQEIARRFTPHVFNHGPERSAQRNHGFERARGRYVLYLDADMALSKRVLEACAARAEDTAPAGLYIPERIVGSGAWIRIRDFERSFYTGTCIDAVRFVERRAWETVGGFDEALSGPEDWDFDRRIRRIGTVETIHEPLYHEEGRFRLRDYLRKKRCYTADLGAYRCKWGADDPDVRRQLGLWYRYVGVFIERGQWVRLLRHPLLSVGMYGLRALVGLQYLMRASPATQRSEDRSQKSVRR